MRATAEQQATHSPKPANSATAALPIKHSADSMQNSSNFPSHPKGRKRDRSDRRSESSKRDFKHYDDDSGQMRSENLLKSEIAKLTDKGGLVDFDSVERLVQLMQPEKSPGKLDLNCRSMLAGIIAATERLDCLTLFIQRRGLPVLDEWLKEVHKGKLGSSTAKDGDRPVEDFLLVLLRALDKLPVDLNALKMCNIGKSVNHLRSHKNLEIQKKARSLVDTWKQRVEAEMNINDTKSSHDGKRQSSGSSEAVMKTSGQLASAKIASLKLVHGETTGKVSSASSGIEKSSSPSLSEKMSIVGGSSEPQTTAREEKSSSSSQSYTNSQCSSDRTRKSGREDARRSTAGSRSIYKTSGATRHQKKSANDLQGITRSAAKKESGTSKHPSLFRSSASEKVSQSTVACATSVAKAKSHKIIAKTHNRGSSASQNATEGGMDELSCTNSRGSFPALAEKCDQADASLMEKSSNCQTNEAHALPEGKQCGIGNDTANLPDIPNGRTTTEKDSQLLDSLLNASTESCVKQSEISTSVPVGDDNGMNLLASVAAGEMSTTASLPVSPLRNNTSADKPSKDYQGMGESNDAEPSRLPSKSNADLQQKLEPSSKTNVKLDDFVGDASKPPGIEGKGTSDGSEQIHMKSASVKAERDSVTDSEHVVKDETLFEKVTDDRPLPCISKHGGEQRKADQLSNNSVLTEYKPPSLTNYSESMSTSEGLVSCSAGADEGLVQNAAKMKAESTCEVDANVPQEVYGRQRDENNSFSNSQKEESGDVFANSDKKSDKLEEKEALVHYSGGSSAKLALSSVGELEPHLSSKSSDVTTAEEKQEYRHSAEADTASLAAAGNLDVDKKLEFDLNEGFNMDDMKIGEPNNFAESLLPTLVSCTSGCTPASVTVAAAAAKGPFVPPEDLLKNKTELGWKGSAATSAFHLAEPRKVLELSTGSSKAPPHDAMACKEMRPLLEIDLNVTDEKILQDLSSQNSGLKINHKAGHKNNLNDEFVGSASLHYSGGFEFDLNRADEVPESWPSLAGSSLRHEVATLPVQLSSSSNVAVVEGSHKRDFDLNNGPSMDEMTFDPLVNQQVHSTIPQPNLTLRMSNATVGNLSSWYSPRTTHAEVTMPSLLADRGDKPFPVVVAGVQQSVLHGPKSGTSSNSDFYRSPLLSSSSVAFATTPFPYPVVPFGTTFSLPTSLSGGPSAYMDPSSAARFCVPTVPAQLVGTTAAVSSQYMRPCVVSVPDISSNSVCESSWKWVRQGLDLNSGPGSLNVEGRNETLPLSSRQLSAAQSLPGEQLRTYQVGSGLSKRKEPDGGWDTDRNSYKQSSWH